MADRLLFDTNTVLKVDTLNYFGVVDIILVDASSRSHGEKKQSKENFNFTGL